MIPAGAIEPDVVLLHGVGLAPCTFDPLMTMISRSSAPLRCRYRAGATTPTAGVLDEAGDLLRTHLGEPDADDGGRRPTVVVGVSGGATLALAMAMIGHPRLLGVVAHEPLVGPAAHDLHAAVSKAAARLAGGDGRAADRATAFVRGLVGDDTWATLPDEAVAFPARHAGTVLDEVPHFVAFSLPSLVGPFAPPVTVTTGERSHPRRREAARVLAAAGARSQMIRGAGHLAAWEQPDTFADLVRDEIARWSAAA